MHNLGLKEKVWERLITYKNIHNAIKVKKMVKISIFSICTMMLHGFLGIEIQENNI